MWKPYGAIDAFEGVSLQGFKTLAKLGRGVGKVQLMSEGDRWVLAFSPPGSQAGKGFYLEAEKSQSVRLFSRADTALRLVKSLGVSGVYVRF